MFATEAGYDYVNKGVNVTVSNATYRGAPLNKLQKLADDIDCDLILDDATVITLPKGQLRSEEPIFISADTGMFGYPTFDNEGISCRCLYNPALQYGGLIEVKSIVPKASGIWQITQLSHHLNASRAGSWESRINASIVAMPSKRTGGVQ
jgi:hypothetical protein